MATPFDPRGIANLAIPAVLDLLSYGLDVFQGGADPRREYVGLALCRDSNGRKIATLSTLHQFVITINVER